VEGDTMAPNELAIDRHMSTDGLVDVLERTLINRRSENQT
jgi:hypothetical protein